MHTPHQQIWILRTLDPSTLRALVASVAIAKIPIAWLFLVGIRKSKVVACLLCFYHKHVWQCAVDVQGFSVRRDPLPETNDATVAAVQCNNRYVVIVVVPNCNVAEAVVLDEIEGACASGEPIVLKLIVDGRFRSFCP